MNSCIPCHPSEDSVLPETNYLEEYGKLVCQASLRDESRDRTILYATCGDPKHGDPILFFPPLGGTRRMLLVLKDALQKHSLWALCVGRPGAEGTIAAKDAKSQVTTFCQDVLAVMDELKIDKIGILCMCAGTPYAMAFCAQYPTRTTGKFLALGPWTLVADCPRSKFTERFAAHYLPTLAVSSLVGSFTCTAMNFFSKETIARKLREKSSAAEQKYLQERYQGNAETLFARDLEWSMGTMHNEKMDVAVCLSKSFDLGFDYKDLEDQDVAIWQGTKDHTAHVPASQWLEKQLPRAKLHLIPDSTHQGALFLLGPEYENALSHLKVNGVDS